MISNVIHNKTKQEKQNEIMLQNNYQMNVIIIMVMFITHSRSITAAKQLRSNNLKVTKMFDTQLTKKAQF